MTTDDHALDKVTTAQQRVIARYCAPPWLSYNECARLERVSPNTANGWKKGERGDVFKHHLEQTRAEALDAYVRELDAMMTALGPKALDVIELGMDGIDAKVQAQNARWVIEQIRGKAKERHEIAGGDGGPITFTIAIDNPMDDRV
jgi:hypothetical protein